MNFQTHCNRYLQGISQTQSTSEATPELSLFPHLQAFFEELSVDHFSRDTITFTQEPRGTGSDRQTGFRRDGWLATHRLY